ncbi:glycosyltransferase [Nocardia yamanashiensis]|uniref:glycosyltransferase n=1 Tax=Nocardia yamanashiensis TaxID=209247 RepID=UPI000833B32B|nr:glycosyltransferase [Nocardia yamanashiensis]
MSDPIDSKRVPELVSIVIAAYHGLPDLDVQLDGLARQDYSGRYEVLISDNSGKDGLREHIAAHPHAEKLGLRYLDNSAKRGAPYARNRAAEVAEGDFLVFVDQDDRVHDTWLRTLIDVAADYDAVGGGNETETLNDRRSPAWRPTPPPESGYDTHWLPFANGNNSSYWRTAFEKIGGFDEELISGGDDVDISWRLQLAGLSFGKAPEALIAYRLRSDLRGAWKQAWGYGDGYAKVCIKHRAAGCPRLPVAATLSSLFVAIVCNPLNPFTRKRVPAGLWVLHTAGLLARMSVSFRYRTYTG